MTTSEWVRHLRICANSHVPDLTHGQLLELAGTLEWLQFYVHDTARQMCVESIVDVPAYQTDGVDDEQVAFAAWERARAWRRELRDLAFKLGVWGQEGGTWDNIVERIDAEVTKLKAQVPPAPRPPTGVHGAIWATERRLAAKHGDVCVTARGNGWAFHRVEPSGWYRVTMVQPPLEVYENEAALLAGISAESAKEEANGKG